MADTSYKRLLTVNETKSGPELVSSSLGFLGLSNTTSYELDDLSVRTSDDKPKWTAKPRAISADVGHKLAIWTQQMLRSFRLLLLVTVGPWKKKEEQPKIALYTGWVSVLTGLLVHVLPLAACIALIYLNVASHFVSNSVYTLAYQFFAKFLELLAQASLGNAIFVYLRALYTGPESVPFGALFAGLQITKISYLWSLEFAGVVTSEKFTRARKIMFLLLIPISVVLAVAVGPSIAIALTPTLGNFHDGWAEAWINATEDQVFPSIIDPASMVYNFSDHCSTGDCAWYGWETAMTVAHLVNQSRNWITGQGPQGSFAMTQDALPNREIRWNATSGNSFLTTTVTIPSKVIAWSLAHLAQQSYRYPEMLTATVHNFTTASLQPSVSINCTSAYWQNSTSVHAPIRDEQTFLYSYVLQSESLRGLNDTQNFRWAFIDSDHPIAQAPSRSNPRVWAVISYPQDAYPPSLGNLGLCGIYTDYAYALNTVSISLANPSIISIMNNQVVSSQTNSLSTSRIDITARWLNHTLPVLGTLLDQGLLEVDVPTFLATSLAISIAQWPKQILNHPNDAPQSLGFASQALNSDPGIVIGTNKTVYINKLFRWLSSSPKDHDFYGVSEDAAVKGKYRLRWDVTSHGYGYRIDQTTKVIAICVLAAYCLYIITFVVLMLALNRVHSNAWDSIGELTALATMSTPDDRLRNTSAGIETVALFKLPINIRANDNNHLEIVFKDDERVLSPGIVEKNKKYN